MSTWSPKAPGSTEYFSVDLVRQLAPGDSIASCTCSISLLAGTDPGVAGMLVGPVVISGTTVAQKVTAGVSGCRYELTFTAITALGETLTLTGDFAVGIPAGERDLCLLEDVRAWLRLKSRDEDDLLQRLITATSRMIETWLSRPILLDNYTDTMDASGTETMALRVTPIQSVASVLVDGQTVEVYNDDLTIWRKDGGRWPWGSTVQVTYTAGFQVVPADIAQACIEIVAFRFRELDRIGHASKSIGGETVSFITKAMPDSAQVLLSQYRRVTPC